MRYLCLIYDDEKKWRRCRRTERRHDGRVLGVHRGHQEERPLRGRRGAAAGATATTVRMRNGKLSTTDGPFAETKEQLGGFYLIEARDLNDAIQVASQDPVGAIGSIEVRPVMDFASRSVGSMRTADAVRERSTRSTAPTRAASSPRSSACSATSTWPRRRCTTRSRRRWSNGRATACPPIRAPGWSPPAASRRSTAFAAAPASTRRSPSSHASSRPRPRRWP